MFRLVTVGYVGSRITIGSYKTTLSWAQLGPRYSDKEIFYLAQRSWAIYEHPQIELTLETQLRVHTSTTVRVRKFDTLPCSESFDNAFALAFQTTNSQELNYLWNGRPNWLSKLGYKYLNNVQPEVRKSDTLPCSESFANEFIPSLRTYGTLWLRSVIICGMAALIDSWNSASTNSTSTMFRSENLIHYLILRVLTMHLNPPYEHSTLHGWGGEWSGEWHV